MIPSAATGYLEGGVAISCLASAEIMALAVLCPFSFRFFLGSVEVPNS